MLLVSKKVLIQVQVGGLKPMLGCGPESMCENYAFAGAAIRCSFCFCNTLSEIRMFEKSAYDSQSILMFFSVCNTSPAGRPIHLP